MSPATARSTCAERTSSREIGRRLQAEQLAYVRAVIDAGRADLVRQIAGSLSPRDQMIFEWSARLADEGITAAQIAERIGRTTARVYQLRRFVVRRLCWRLRAKLRAVERESCSDSGSSDSDARGTDR